MTIAITAMEDNVERLVSNGRSRHNTYSGICYKRPLVYTQLLDKHTRVEKGKKNVEILISIERQGER